MQKLSRWFRDNSLWIVGLGLMLASSGIDGAYMTKWMPLGFGWLGLVLNTMSDVSSMVLVYWFGRLQMDRSSTKRRLSNVLLAAEIVAVVYSWFFGYRQLRAVLPQHEPQDWPWVSIVSAGFIPLLLAFVGYAQSLLAGRVNDAKQQGHAEAPQQASAEEMQDDDADVKEDTPSVQPHARRKATIDDWRHMVARLGASSADLNVDDVIKLLYDAGLALPSARTLYHWARIAREEDAS